MIQDKELMYMIKANLLDSLVKKLDANNILPGIEKMVAETVMAEYDVWKYLTAEITPLYKQS